MPQSRLELFGHIRGIFRPPSRWIRPPFAGVIGRRGLFQVVGRICEADQLGHRGEWALMPRERGWPFHRVPASWVSEVEPAASPGPEAASWRRPSTDQSGVSLKASSCSPASIAWSRPTLSWDDV